MNHSSIQTYHGVWNFINYRKQMRENFCYKSELTGMQMWALCGRGIASLHLRAKPAWLTAVRKNPSTYLKWKRWILKRQILGPFIPCVDDDTHCTRSTKCAKTYGDDKSLIIIKAETPLLQPCSSLLDFVPILSLSHKRIRPIQYVVCMGLFQAFKLLTPSYCGTRVF